MKQPPLYVRQANVFYNYTLGFQVTSVDLLKTAIKALKAGISTSAYFSDNKFIYLDDKGETQVEWIHPEGRQWDTHHSVKFEKEFPERVMKELTLILEASFHEDRIEAEESQRIGPFLRLSLPPIVLEDNQIELPLFVSVKIFADGIAILSFQLDGTWDDADESIFITEIVNLFRRYYKKVWVDSKIQSLDAENTIPNAFKDQISLAGTPLKGYKVKRIIKDMQKHAQEVFREAMSKEGRTFTIDDEPVILHEIAAFDNTDLWESNLDLCRSIYTSALSIVLAPDNEQKQFASWTPLHWEGRPSITLMRFRDQPENKSELISNFGPSLLRILARSTDLEHTWVLPVDLRPIGDFSFHGNRAVLLWTWTKQKDSPENAWDDINTRSLIMNHQARAEHIEYYNMRLARACDLARFPPSEDHLIEAYRTLSMAENDLHHSGSAGEITDVLKTLIKVFGTMDLVPPAKEAARWHLDEMRHKSEKRRLQVDRWLTLVFGLVGTTGLAEFLVKPYLEIALTGNEQWVVPLLSFVLAATIVLILVLFVWLFTRR